MSAASPQPPPAPAAEERGDASAYPRIVGRGLERLAPPEAELALEQLEEIGDPHEIWCTDCQRAIVQKGHGKDCQVPRVVWLVCTCPAHTLAEAVSSIESCPGYPSTLACDGVLVREREHWSAYLATDPGKRFYKCPRVLRAAALDVIATMLPAPVTPLASALADVKRALGLPCGREVGEVDGEVGEVGEVAGDQGRWVGRCEGCWAAPATTLDDHGVPLCEGCAHVS